MACLQSSATSLQLPKITYCVKPPPSYGYPHNALIHARYPRRSQVTIKVKRKETSFKSLCVGGSRGQEKPTHNSDFVPPSPLDAVVDDFYTCLNEKNLQRLHKLIADNCVVKDLAFFKPFEGKKEVHHFLKDLTEATGKDVKFIVDRVYQARELSIAVLWHLEWQKRHIPLATGCSFFDCTLDGESLLIKNAVVYSESPLKPGEFVLTLLKIISSLFDKFPEQAKWFLEKSQALIQFMIKAYKIVVEPFIVPLLAYYTNLWTYGARLDAISKNEIRTKGPRTGGRRGLSKAAPQIVHRHNLSSIFVLLALDWSGYPHGSCF